jgi:hypothetical protein
MNNHRWSFFDPCMHSTRRMNISGNGPDFDTVRPSGNHFVYSMSGLERTTQYSLQTRRCATIIHECQYQAAMFKYISIDSTRRSSASPAARQFPLPILFQLGQHHHHSNEHHSRTNTRVENPHPPESTRVSIQLRRSPIRSVQRASDPRLEQDSSDNDAHTREQVSGKALC